jgi:Glycosyl transferase family 2
MDQPERRRPIRRRWSGLRPRTITELRSTMANPRVTVLMPVFNRERFLDDAIESVLEQDFSGLELLIVDDGSTDGTSALLQQWQRRDTRVVVITSAENQGIPSALNTGLAQARAPYVARLDSDDVMMPGRLAAQAAVLDCRPDVTLVSSAYETMDADGRYLDTWRGDEPHEVVVYFLGFYNIVGGGGQVMFRRSEVLAEGGYPCEYPSSEDYALWVRLLRRGRVLTLPIVGMKQRNHGARSSVQYAAVKRSNWTAIMSDSLGRYLGRSIRPEEIAALITLWRFDLAVGMASAADRTMREAFARFRSLYSDPELRRCVRQRTARQWIEKARAFAAGGNLVEAARFLMRAAWWSPAVVIGSGNDTCSSPRDSKR